MILADDNFANIITAIEQGRNIYNNIKKSVVYLLATNVGEVVAMVVAILIGMPAPFIATQLLWINLLTDTLPAVALGMDPGDPDVMQQEPRNPKESFFAKGAGMKIMLGGTLIGLLTIFAFDRVSKTAAWLLVPYISWVSFAAMLNFAIYRLN